MNYQREAVYARRRNALSGERIEIDVQNMMIDTADLLASRAEGLEFSEFEEMVMGKLSIDLGFDEAFYANASADAISDALRAHMEEVYRRRMDTMAEKVYPFIKQVFEKQGQMYKNIAIPISDGRKMLTLSVDLEKAYNTNGKEIAKALSRTIILYQIDDHWKQHLRDMDDLRQSVQNAAYEQKDPLLIYKFESFKLFEQMLLNVNREITSFLSRATLPLPDENQVREARQPQAPQKGLRAGRQNDFDRAAQQQQQAIDNSSQQPQKVMPVHVEKKVGRNDPCPCGSGKKYKNCHGRDAE